VFSRLLEDTMASREHELPGDAGAVEALLDRAFGPGRELKTAERLREGNRPAIALVARDEQGAVVGTVRLWPILVGRRRALLLGPLAVAEARRCERIGARLMRRALAEAGWSGWGAVLLVGDEPYYGRFGFDAAPTAKLSLPGPVDPARFLALELRRGALAGAAGPVRADLPQDDKVVAMPRRRVARRSMPRLLAQPAR
jgi:predicted N-acetyltransferase YhbS